MRSKTQWVVCATAGAFGVFAILTSAAERDTKNPPDGVSHVESTTPTESRTVLLDDLAISAQPPAELHDAVAGGEVIIHDLPPGTVFQRVVIGPDGAEGVVAGAERLVYSNVNGLVASAPGANKLYSDDVAIASKDGCGLLRYTYKVTGKALPDGTGGPFSVTSALYTSCPQSVGSTTRAQLLIQGTQQTFNSPDDAPREITVVAPAGTNMVSNMWFGVTFSRANAAVIVGSPALVGFSGDVIDIPGFACANRLGGFPAAPHASFNLQIFGDEATCPVAHVAYKDHNAAGSTFANGGANVYVADDLAFLENGCNMIGYDVAVRGSGTFIFQFQNGCDDSSAIPGTVGVFAQTQITTEPRVRRFTFDPPIRLPRTPWFAVRPNNGTSGIVLAGPPMLGDTSGEYCKDDPVTGLTQVAPPSVYGGFHVAITCAGEAPTGACCDMYVTQCRGGESDGKACKTSEDCLSPGSCEAACRVVPLANCPFPRGTTLRPDWQEGQTCDSDPFPNVVCGEAACCYKGTNPPSTLDAERCLNLTRNTCDAQFPLKRCDGGSRSTFSCTTDADCPQGTCVPAPRQWQAGRFCGVLGQDCPLNACLGRAGDCTTIHPTPGCSDPDCCTTVCRQPNQDFCCEVEWDGDCVSVGTLVCTTAPSNDKCSTDREGYGAKLISVPSTTIAFVKTATPTLDQVALSTEPEFCCHNGLPLMCHGGNNAGFICAVADDCPDGTCDLRPPKAMKTVWFKFVAPEQGSVLARTCSSQNPNNDSIMQIFAAGDPTSDQTACTSLAPIACNDDKAGCGTVGKNSNVCAAGLTPGRIYYLMVGVKSEEYVTDQFNLSLTAGCTVTGPANDACLPGTPLDDGTTAFDLALATPTCPPDDCAPTMDNDLWYDYRSSCTGEVTIDTCSSPSSPNTNVVVYDGCQICPPAAGAPVDCNGDADLDTNNCNPGDPESVVQFQAQIGDCFKVRIGDENGGRGAGQIHASCAPICGAGLVTFIDPPAGILDARRPHDPSGVPPIVPLLGYSQMVVNAPTLGGPVCWKFCETAEALGEANSITDVVQGPPGTWTLTFARPITPDAATRVSYLGNAPCSLGTITSHPGNVDSDFAATSDDVVALVSALAFWIPRSPSPDEPPPPPPPPVLTLPMYSADIDRSGVFGPLDILDEIDLLKGAASYEPHLDTIRPSVGACNQVCP